VVNKNSLSSGFDIGQGSSGDAELGGELHLRQVQAAPPASNDPTDGLVDWLQLHPGTDHMHAQPCCQYHAQKVCNTHHY